jgi:hypothetical protein
MVVLSLLVGFSFSTSTPASAHGEVVCVYAGDDAACHSGPGYEKGLRVCDNELDGNWVYVDYETSTGHYTMYDRGGFHTDCTNVQNVPGYLISFIVCEELPHDDLCSERYYH